MTYNKDEENKPAMKIGDREYGGGAGPMQASQSLYNNPDMPRPQEIGWAVKQMWNRQAVTRRGWNGRHAIRIQFPNGAEPSTSPYVYITAQNHEVRPWLCSQADLLASDWQLHEVD